MKTATITRLRPLSQKQRGIFIPAFSVVLGLLGPGAAFAVPPDLVAPASLVPAAEALPEPWWALKALLLLTFCIHLLLMNVLVGSTVIILARAASKKRPEGFSLGREVSFLPKVLALTVNFGVAPFLFVQVLYGSYIYSSSILMAFWWLGVAGIVMFAYYGLYIVGSDASPGLPRSRLMLALALALLLTTAFLLVTNNTLMLRPERWPGWFARPHGTLLNLGDPMFWPRLLHMLIGSLAVGGLAMACRAWWRNRAEKDAPGGEGRDMRRGLDWFFYATLLQVPVGIWFLFSLPGEVYARFLGGSALATTALVLALAGAVLALFLARGGRVLPASGVTAGVVLLMVCVRDMARDVMLLPYAAAAEPMPLALPQGQDGAFVLFLACAALAVAIISWLGRVAFRSLSKAGAVPGEAPMAVPASASAPGPRVEA